MFVELEKIGKSEEGNGGGRSMEQNTCRKVSGAMMRKRMVNELRWGKGKWNEILKKEVRGEASQREIIVN